MNRSKWIAAILTLVGIYYYYMKVKQANPGKSESLSSYSLRSSGTFIASKYLNDIQKDVKILRRPLLDLPKPKKSTMLWILSPTRPLSKMEGEKVLDFVKNGGWVYAAFQTRKVWQNFKHLESHLGRIPDLIENSGYQHQNPLDLTIGQEEWSLLDEKKEFAFYSPIRFLIKDYSGARFIREIPIDKGGIILQAGLPLFSNGLISRGDNEQALTAIADKFDAVIIDEYHHYYQESVLDLLTSPRFFIPITSMIFLLILSISYTRFDELIPKKEPLPIEKQWSDFISEMIAKGLIKPTAGKDAVDLQAKVIRRLFPEADRQIQQIVESQMDPKGKYIRLLEVHKNAHQNKGG